MFIPAVVVKEGAHFPGWCDPFHPEAVRATKALRDIDGALLVTFVHQPPPNVGLPPYSFVTWVRSRQYRGYVPDRILQDDHGNPLRGILPVEDLLRDFRMIYQDAERGIFAPQRAEEENDRQLAEYESQERAKHEAMFEYARPAIMAELDGVSRFSPQDVVDGYDAANESKKAAPAGQVISIPVTRKGN